MIAFTLAIFLSFQPRIDAGPAQASCEASSVTLAARVEQAPLNFQIQWEDAAGPGTFLVVNPSQSGEYQVTLTNLDTQETYTDSTQVLVHPGDPDLNHDGFHNAGDLNLYYEAFGTQNPELDLDPNQNNRVDILDFFYFCDHDRYPPNTPPGIEIQDTWVTYRNEAIEIPYSTFDNEQNVTLQIRQHPTAGNAFKLGSSIFYTPDNDYLGEDQFAIIVTDGYVETLPIYINVTVLMPETWDDLYNDILFQECRACHIDAVSGGLSLATYQLAATGGNSGPAFLSGDPQLSPLYIRVRDGSMPLGRPPLSEEDIERIRLWILRGANE